jgi:hypothetical protein
MNFTRGIIILTVLLLSVTVSFFMGRILGNELMTSGREQLEPFTSPTGEDAEAETAFAGHTQSPYGYEGPTSDRFPLSMASTEDEDAASSDTHIITIGPIESSDDSGESSDEEAEMSDLFSLDEAQSSEGAHLFRVQVGVFQVRENADSLAAALRKEAYNAYTQEVVFESGEVRWKVYVGPFSTLEDANVTAEELRDGNYDCYVQ